ncbi:hypothetical protein AU252_22750 [Pseudarthrobacter sulfonivorans]|uniref:Uncharacterized protein n=1 Tax=Pseudarthrobacter sulfonivorans TaxID=121292 RepID=A0A0U3FIZ9_9MICC|nr:hypothetical protein AU252_22750 [Pseudarthrobacter sulfonivorans]
MGMVFGGIPRGTLNIMSVNRWTPSRTNGLLWPTALRAHIQSSLHNAELIFRGSRFQDSLAPGLPHRTVTPWFTADVDTHLKAVLAPRSAERTAAARRLGNSLDGEEPTTAQLAELLAQRQLPQLRDSPITDMPGPHLPMELLLFGESVTSRELEACACPHFCQICARRNAEMTLSCEDKGLWVGSGPAPSLLGGCGAWLRGLSGTFLGAACPGLCRPAATLVGH